MEEKEFKALKFLLGILLIIFLIVVSFWFGADTLNKIKQNKLISRGHTITVFGVGEVWAKPDLAIIDFSVNSEKKTIKEAFEENVEKMNSIIEAMKKQGIDEKDLKTINFNIYPRYEWQANVLFPNEKRVLVGYTVEQTLRVKIRDLNKTGEIVELALKNGANQVGSLQFTIENEDQLKSLARKEAIEKAKERAKEIAQQLGVKLIRVMSFAENPGSPFYSYPLVAEKSIGENTPQIQPGENKIRIEVSLTYEIE